MTALLVYRNDRPAILDWARGYRARDVAQWERRQAFVDAFYAAHGHRPEDGGGTFSRGTECTGIAWPADVAPPKGWRRPPEEQRMVKPHLTTKVGKAAQKQLDELAWEDAREQLRKEFGMPSFVIAPIGRYYTPGVRIEDDAVWVVWGSRDIVPELGLVEDHGWQRVALTDFIDRFGEDALVEAA